MSEEEKEKRRLYAKQYREANKAKLSSEEYLEIKRAKAKEYYKKNKDKIIASKNKENVKVIAKRYYDNHKEQILAKRNVEEDNQKQRERYKENPEKAKEYYQKNKEVINKRTKEYYTNNKETINKKQNERNKERMVTDPVYNVKRTISSLIRYSIKSSGFKKLSRSEQILGCSFEEFKNHIESKFEDWMTWSNKGNPKDGILELNKSWDIDHIIPLSTAKCEADIIRLNHYTNLQPLCSYTNRYIKKDNPI